MPRPRIARPRIGGFDELRDRLRGWHADARVAVVVLVVVAVGAGLLWYRLGAAGDGAPAPSRATTATSTRRSSTTSPATAPADSTATSRPSGPAVVVHVAGAVARPGVLELVRGARVIDAVEGAGGALPDADLDRLNLAAKVTDGQQVLVPKVGQLPGGPTPGPAAPGGDAGAPAGPLDLNAATQEQLEELPGLGPVLAGAIVDERERRGGFRSVNELRDVRGIGEKRFEELRELVTV